MSSDESTSETNGQSAAPGITADDICYTLFRHKWLILGFVCLGLAASAFVRIARPPKYASRAELMIKFVLDRQVANPITGDAPKLITENSQNILTTEIEMIRSLDVATNAAGLLSPEVLAKMGVSTNPMAASGAIQSGIEVENPRSTSILAVMYKHRDESIVQPILQAIITAYKIKHNAVYGLGNVDSFAMEQVESLRGQLAATEEAIKQLTASNHLVSVEQTKRTYQTQIERCQERLIELEGELARRTAMLGAVATSVTNGADVVVPREKLTAYTDLVSDLESLKRNKATLLQTYTEAYPTVANVQGRIERLTKEKAKLETEFPSLARMSLTPSTVGTNSAESELSMLLGIRGEVEWRTKFLSNLQAQAQSVMELEPKLNELMRLRNQLETNYNAYSKIISDSMLTRALGPGNMVNMSEVQHPTPPWRDTKKFMKLVMAAFVGCSACGLGLAFLLDFVINRTINRREDAERHLKLPVLLSIPDLNWNRNGKNLPARTHAAHSESNGGSGGAVTLWDPKATHIEMYADGLRERLMTYFESRNLNLKKPKLVAVTECGEGAGVTVIANNLAASLSRTSGNVLLVDMKGENGAARAFFQGRPGGMISNLMEGQIEHGQSEHENGFEQNNGEENNNKLACALPNKFNHIVPKLRASDYDYIVFDMPAISPVSATPRLGSYMDIVLLVLESEKTGQQLAARATGLMREARANVAAVVNKYRAHVPARLSQEL